MRFYVRKKRAPSIIIVSLIDILVVLLIFFIVTTSFNKSQPQVMINLPDSKTAEAAPAEKNQPIVLRVKNGEDITLNEKPVKLGELAAALKAAREKEPERSVALQADRDASFGVVVKVLDSLKEAGIKNIPAFTKPENQAK